MKTTNTEYILMNLSDLLMDGFSIRVDKNKIHIGKEWKLSYDQSDIEGISMFDDYWTILPNKIKKNNLDEYLYKFIYDRYFITIPSPNNNFFKKYKVIWEKKFHKYICPDAIILRDIIKVKISSCLKEENQIIWVDNEAKFILKPKNSEEFFEKYLFYFYIKIKNTDTSFYISCDHIYRRYKVSKNFLAQLDEIINDLSEFNIFDLYKIRGNKIDELLS